MRSNSKNIALISLVLSFVIILTPQVVNGFAFDLASNQLDAISEYAGPIAALTIGSLVFFAIGQALLLVSSFLLQGIISATPTLLTVTSGEASAFIRLNWGFTAGLVNMILIIAFIVIAFSVILGSTKIQLKKTLPMLIVVALLVNFTLLFVGAGIDITNFLYNSIANQFLSGNGGNILYNAISPLFSFSTGQLAWTMGLIAATAASLLVPYLNVAVQLAWVFGLKAAIVSASQFLTYGAIMWGMAGLFFLYFLVFLIRIFVIQILAVIAPLAFFCLIFDDTKKYWNQWLSALLQWLFVGVIFIFLMYFGLAMAPTVMSVTESFQNVFEVKPSWFGGGMIDGFLKIIPHIALLAYFIVIMAITKSFVPTAVNAVIDQAKGFAKIASPYTGAIATGTMKGIRAREEERSKDIKEREARAKIERPGFVSRAYTSAKKGTSWAIRRAHNIAGTSVSEERKKDVKSELEDLKKKHGDDYEDFIQSDMGLTQLRGLRTANLVRGTAELQFLAGGGADALTKLPPDVLADLIEGIHRSGDSKTIKNVVKHIPDFADVSAPQKEIDDEKEKEEKDRDKTKIKKAEEKLNLATKIQSAMMSEVKKVDGSIEELKEELKTLDKDGDEYKEKKKEIEEAVINAINKISVQSLKSSDVENLSSSTVKNGKFLEAIIENKSIEFIRAFENRKDVSSIVKDLSNTINTMDVEELKRLNPTLYGQIKKTPAGQALFEEFHDKIKREETSS
jgi:hypothetical protein